MTFRGRGVGFQESGVDKEVGSMNRVHTGEIAYRTLSMLVN